MLRSTLLAFGLVALLGLALAPAPVAANSPPVETTSADWNDDVIEWHSYEAGIAKIKASGKPGVLVFFTTWCPHCHDYSRVFHAEEVVELSKDFVMIRVDRDAYPAVSGRYSKHGNYIPRTHFLDARAVVDYSQTGSNDRFPHYLDTQEPGELLGLMRSFKGAPAKAE